MVGVERNLLIFTGSNLEKSQQVGDCNVAGRERRYQKNLFLSGEDCIIKVPITQTHHIFLLQLCV